MAVKAIRKHMVPRATSRPFPRRRAFGILESKGNGILQSLIRSCECSVTFLSLFVSLSVLCSGIRHSN